MGGQGNKESIEMAGLDLKKSEIVPVEDKVPMKENPVQKWVAIPVKEGGVSTGEDSFDNVYMTVWESYPEESHRTGMHELWGSQVHDISITSVSIPNTQYNVHYRDHDMISFTREEKSFEAIIPPGHYDIKSLPLRLAALMNKEDPDNSYEVKYDSISKRLTFSGKYPFSFDWNGDTLRDARLFLGMPQCKGSSTSHTGIYIPDLCSCLNVDIVVEFLKGDQVEKLITFPIILDEDKEITVRNYDSLTAKVGLWFYACREIKISLMDKNGRNVPGIGRWTVNARIRREKYKIIIKTGKEMRMKMKRRASI